jgi:hypothetical protein
MIKKIKSNNINNNYKIIIYKYHKVKFNKNIFQINNSNNNKRNNN